MSFGKGSNTTTSTTQPNAQAMGAYSNLLARANQVASTPYQAYGGEGVAGINAQQMMGINNINANAGFASPYIQQASQYAQQAAQPISAADIQRYENPYTNDVINAQQAQYNQANAQQQSQVMGNAAAQGALGGNRAGVAQALTAGQQQMAQAPVLANLRSQGYQSGLNTALAEQQNMGQAAYSMGNLGVAGQNAALTGANAQIGAGTMQQQTQQALDQYLYGQFQQQQAYPYQQLSWLAGIDTGVGSQMGGSSQTTGPSPNPWSQFLGLGMAGLGAFSDRRLKDDIHRIGTTNDDQPIYRFRYKGDPRWQIGLMAQDVEKSHPEAVGGVNGYKTVDLKEATDDAVHRRNGGVVRPHFDSGGVAGMPWAGAPSWIPAMQITHGKGAPSAPSAPSQQQNPFGNPATLAKGIKGLGSLGSSLGEQFPEAAAYLSNPMEMFSLGGESTGGAVFERGGGVHGYAEGGAPDYGDLEGGFDPDVGAFSSRLEAPLGFLPVTGRADHEGHASLGSGVIGAPNFVDRFSPAEEKPLRQLSLRDIGSGPVTEASLAENPDLSDIPADQPTGGVPRLPAREVASHGVANLDAEPTGGMGIRPGSQGAPELPAHAKESGFGGLFHLSDAARTGLMAAGLGMMASRSPFLGNAIGEGGLAGLSAYSGTKQEEVRADEVAKKLKEHHEEVEKKLAAQSAHEARMAEAAEKGRVPPGYRFNNGNLEAIPGGPHDPSVITKQEEAKAAGKGSSSAMSPEAKEIMARQMIAGNFTGYNSLGRTAQGLAVRNELNNLAAEIAMRERGLTAAQAAEYLNDQKQQFGAHQIGLNTEARTTGQREANLNLILKVTDAAIPAALEASEKVARTGWVPINQIIQRGEVMASNPELREFGMANLQLAEGWARAMNPTGVMRESDRDKALSFLSTADSKETYKRAVLQLQKQITRERDSIRAVDPRTPLNPALPAAAAPELQGQDKAALDWANANPNDPRAVAIKRKLGVQ